MKAIRAGLVLALLGVAALAPAGALSDSPPYKLTSGTLHATGLGPNSDQYCDVVYDRYVPDSASAAHQVPAILTTNGFGGSKADQAGEADMFARHGYEVISYSGLGFGGSSCAIETDSPEWDGKAASQFVDLLAKSDEVLKDGPNDPRVGTWGGSYGGGFQFALVSVDKRIDAMIPIITWNDLAYSLAPNNDTPTLHYKESPPGVLKFEWSDLFYADGVATGPAKYPQTSGWISGNPPDPACPAFDQTVCVINTESTAMQYPTSDTVSFLRHASAQYEVFEKPGVHIPPAMLIQGETDSLFDMADAVANMRGFQAHGVPVKLVMESGGHSGPSAPGEVDNTDVSKGYHDQLWLNWYDHYLRGLPVSTGPQVEYFRDWVKYTGSAKPAYGSFPSWPVGTTQSWYLSADNSGSLVASPSQVVAGALSMVNTGAVSSYSETSAVETTSPISLIPPTDPPGEFAAFTSPVLTDNLDSVGIATADFTISQAIPPVTADPATEVTLFGKIYDLAPDGTKTLVHRLVSPIRVADPSKPVHVNLPGVVHRYAKGDRIQLVLATTDQAYVPSRVANQVSVMIDPAKPAKLTVPVVSPDQEDVAAASTGPTATGSSGTLAQLPNTGTGSGSVTTTGAPRAFGLAFPLLLAALITLALRTRRSKPARMPEASTSRSGSAS